MGLAEGFAQGFGLVDAALQRRRANELEEQKMAQDKAYKEREFGLKDAEIGVHRQNADTYAKYYQSQIDNIGFDNKLARDTFEETKKNNGIKNRIDLNNSETSLLSAQGNFLHNQALVAKINDETRRAKELEAREKAIPIYEGMQTQDGKLAFSSNPELLNQQLDALHTLSNVDWRKAYENPAEFDGHVQNIKSGLVNPAYWQQNKDSILKSLNTIQKRDIEAGKIGTVYDGNDRSLVGGRVENVAIDDAMPSPNGDGLVFSVKTTYKMPDGSLKETQGPMTDLRTANPNVDPNVRVVPYSGMVGKLDALDQISKAVNNDKTHLQYIQSLIKQTNGGKSEDKNIQDNYLKFNEKKTNPTTSEETESTVYKDPKTGREIRLGSPESNKQDKQSNRPPLSSFYSK